MTRTRKPRKAVHAHFPASPPLHASNLPFQVPYVRYAEIHYRTEGYTWGPRQIYDHALFYTISGSGTVRIEDQTYSAAPDSLFLLLPRQTHLTKTDSDWAHIGIHFDWVEQPDSHLLLQFDPMTIGVLREVNAQCPAIDKLWREPRAITGWNLDDSPFLDLQHLPQVRSFLEQTVVAFGREDAESRGQAGALLAAAIWQIQHEARRIERRARYRLVGENAQHRIERACHLLGKETRGAEDKPLSITEVAEQVGWSADHLAHMFRIALNTTPRRVRMTARLERAKQLLQQGMAVGDVAQCCNFADSSHFARVFRKEVGVTPGRFLAAIHHA